ncbi:sigma-54-dependent Fis family transcriptional regulator [Lysinibacillus antri]|uniref:AAA family ATPase n=1 Tax=Lysinibacillus antri TaxID=2498145 RepID=A0A432L8S9_9BACI|nr:sigma 54-interacting transcriptional regulator [Lysinibacillus antri]RUL48808.1 AAA family ATPase [Lysinibacillus antri]
MIAIFLRDIQPTVQSIAEAIATVLKLEVEIADADYVRIACTGKLQIDILKKLEGNLVYKTVMETKQPIIIRNPGYEEVCKQCPFYQNCIEMGEISAPIISNNNVIGFIGLMAINNTQRQRLFKDVDGILSFLNKMADLLASKLQQSANLHQLKAHSEKMDLVINLVDYGVLIIDDKGQIIQKNKHAHRLLNLDTISLNSDVISKWVKNLLTDDEYENRTFTLQTRPVDIQTIVTKKLLSDSGNRKEYLIILQDVNYIQTIADKTKLEAIRKLDSIIGKSEQIQQLREHTLIVSRTASSILLQGESGTGKEVFAKSIHAVGERSKRAFITVNCGAIPEHLLESELFGYEKGAFTGANTQGKVGKFELANGGTIFLDEIGEMPLHLQVKLLRVLQENEIERVGGTKVIPIDVRVIAATNKDLQSSVKEGVFREDLFYRLNVVPIFIPPLRSRKEDIPELCDYFISEYNEIFGKNVMGFDSEMLQILMNYRWPGNVRELKNFIEYLFNFISEGYITLNNSKELIDKKLKLDLIEEEEMIFSLKRNEMELIKKALEYVKQHNMNVEDATKLLGISRATLFRKLKEYQNVT